MGATPVASGGPDLQPTTNGWLDPALVLAAAGNTPRRVTLPPATPTLILGTDAERVAFLIIASAGIGKMPRLSPFPDVVTFGIPEDAGTSVLSFALQEWFSLVPAEWFAFSTGGGDILIYEFRNYY